MSAHAKMSGTNAPALDWRRVAYHTLVSRALDELEEKTLVPERKIFYQFSARGHDMAQVMLGLHLTNPNDAVCGYYRSRPYSAGAGRRSGGRARFLDGAGRRLFRRSRHRRGVQLSQPEWTRRALPMCGGVGAQYTPTAGWAQALEYRAKVLKEKDCGDAIGVALGGDASVATNGFWSALTMATTLKLPMLFYIEDNGYGISVPSTFQTPGADIAANLAGFNGLKVISGDGTDPGEAARLIERGGGLCPRAVARRRLLRLTVPRLEGHSFQDTQTYKPAEFVERRMGARSAAQAARPSCARDLQRSRMGTLSRKRPKRVSRRHAREPKRGLTPTSRARRVTCSSKAKCRRRAAMDAGYQAPVASDEAKPEGQRINMVTAIRRTLEHELAINPRVVVFGEDVGPKGGVHAVTLGLQEKFGAERVFDTSLSEEGIIGRAVGMALAGLMPVPEIQFRKYADPAAEQLNDCGTMRWRTNNRFAAPMVVRMPIGFFKCGDPWHSQTNEVQFVHSPGWKVAVPSNAEDAVGLLRASSARQRPGDFLRASRHAGCARARGGPIRATISCCRSAKRAR